jgi:predicted MFS family arabinose efflux permease
MSNLPVSSSSTAPIYWMALGTFAIGTESFMIVPLLPKIATNLSVSVSEAGQLVTAFTLALALSSPVLTALTGNFNRRKLLFLSRLSTEFQNGSRRLSKPCPAQK